MSTIGSLDVAITASTDKFIQSLHNAESTIGNFVKKISTVQNAVVGLATYGFESFIEKALEVGHNLEVLTEKLHVSAEQLTGLHYAAKQLGATTEALDNGIAFMSKTLGKASEGTDTAIAAFNRLGLDFHKLLEIPVEEQFLAIVDGLNKIPGAAQRAAAAQAIFGRGSKELAAILSAGTEEIIKQGKAAADMGAIVSTETVEDLGKAAKSVESFGDSWNALWLQAVSWASPLIMGAMDVLTITLKSLSAVWYGLELVAVGAVDTIAEAVLKLEEALNMVLPKMAQFDTEKVKSYVAAFGDAERGIYHNLDLLNDGNNPLTKATQDLSGHATTGKEVKAEAKDKKQEEKQIAKETALANKHLAEISKKLDKPPQFSVAGVR